MRLDPLELDDVMPPAGARPALPAHRAEAIRLLLSGGSAVDFHRAHFDDTQAIDDLLGLFLLDPNDAFDQRRLRYLLAEAAAYVEEIRGVRIPSEVRNPTDVRDLFRWASDVSGLRRRQMAACMVLKMMHLIQHMESADLKLRADVSEYDLQELAHGRIVAASETLRRTHGWAHAFFGSRKTRSSVIQKLLLKRENVAATIFDKLRYRLVVATPDDLIDALDWLLTHLLPFPLIVPGNTRNNLLDPSMVLARTAAEAVASLHPHLDDIGPVDTMTNPFSGRDYRMINLVADLPVRLSDRVLPGGQPTEHLGRVVHVLVEFQVVDAVTNATNQVGENAHTEYKARQWQRASDRLARGAYVR